MRNADETWSRRRVLAAAAAMGSVAAGAAACGRTRSALRPATASRFGAAPLARHAAGGVDRELIARRYPGLRPFAAAPPAPAAKPIDLDRPTPPLITWIPTDQRIVFVTLDDGLEKEPAFVRMVRDFQVPLTLFLTNAYIESDYAYFAALLDTGLVTLQNHTLTHPDLRALPPAAQLDQLGGQQELLRRHYGATPYLFRPPYGAYDAATLEAVRQAPGLRGVSLWTESMRTKGLHYTRGRALRPGDVILSHFAGPAQLRGGSMVGMMANLFKQIQAQGFTVAKLTDYV